MREIYEMVARALAGTPSALKPAQWQTVGVKPWEARVEISASGRPHAYLPLDDDTPESRAVLAHEFGHVALTRPPQAIPADCRAPNTEPFWLMIEEWRVDMRLVAAGANPDPRIGMDRFDWTAIIRDAALMGHAEIALGWMQLAYVQTGAKNPTVKTRAAELWSLLTDEWRKVLTDAWRAVSADPWSDDVQDRWTRELAAMLPPTSQPRTRPHAGAMGYSPLGTPPQTKEAQEQDQERRQDKNGAWTIQRRGQSEQTRDQLAPDPQDKAHAQSAASNAASEREKPQAPGSKSARTRAEKATSQARREANKPLSESNPDKDAAESAADQMQKHALPPGDQPRQGGRPDPATSPDASQEAAERIANALDSLTRDLDHDQPTSETPRPSQSYGNGPSVRSRPASEPERRAIMQAGRETWRDCLVIHNHLARDRENTKRVLELEGPSEYGTRVLDITRMWSDLKVFDSGARPGGTVIIDGSASMRWSPKTLEDLILACPGVTVAVYFQPRRGRHRPLPMLCVVAQNGMRADDFLTTCYETASGGNDGSDLPALAWLAEAKHRAPRLILSDGEYWTMESPSGWLLTYEQRSAYNERCNLTMRQGRILRVPTVEGLFDALLGKTTDISEGDRLYPLRRRAAR